MRVQVPRPGKPTTTVKERERKRKKVTQKAGNKGVYNVQIERKGRGAERMIEECVKGREEKLGI
jgi:hypothetical protein